MLLNPVLTHELRTLFKAGATPSVLIRRIAQRHASQPHIDGFVRAYFRAAFHLPTVQIGADQVKQIAEGANLSIFNVTIVPRIIQTRREWDTPDSSDPCGLDTVVITDQTTLIAESDPLAIPELAASWDGLDEVTQQYIQRIIGNAHALHEKVNVLAALAEQIQQQTTNTVAQ